MRHVCGFIAGLLARASAVAFAALVFVSAPQVSHAQVPTQVVPVPPAIPPMQRPHEETGPVLEVPPYRGVAPPGSDEVTLAVSKITIEGASVYSPDELAAMTSVVEGKTVALTEVFAVADRLQAKYRSDGYVLTRVILPSQKISDGNIRIVVVEGYISDVQIKGDAGGAMSLVEGMLGHITGQRPATAAMLERWLLLVNDIPGIIASGVLRPGAEGLGSTQLVVEVSRKPIDAFATVTNRGSKFTGPWSGAVGAATNSFTPVGERIDATYFQSFDRRDHVFIGPGVFTRDGIEQQFYDIGGEFRILDGGLIFRGRVGRTLSHPGATLTLLEIDSRAQRFSGELAYPVIRSRRENFWITGGLLHIEERTDVSGTPSSRDRLTALSLGASYDMQDSYLTEGVAPSKTSFSIVLSQGIDLFNPTDDNAIIKSRLQGTAFATVLNATVERIQTLTGKADLYLAVSGQYSFSDALLSQQEFRIGGEEYGRGYDPSELAGDSGMGATAELRYRDSTGWRYVTEYELYGFYDFGIVWNEDTGFDPRDTLNSTGFGARLTVTDNVDLDVEMARTLTRILGSRNDDRDTTRGFVRLTVRY